jgi:hypothetical protein
MICEGFKNSSGGTHYCELEDEHKWSMMFTNGDGENCAINGTDEEVAHLLTDDYIANSFVMIGDSADEWKDEVKRQKLIDMALKLIKERERD